MGEAGGTLDGASAGEAGGGAERDRMDRKHVFVVNGSPEFLDLARDLLQEERYNVTTTNFVPQTFDQIAALQPSLLMVDLAVGARAGWELLQRLNGEAVTNGIPVVVVSTDPSLLEEAKAQQARYGGQHFQAKPFDIDELVRAVEDLIGPA